MESGGLRRGTDIATDPSQSNGATVTDLFVAHPGVFVGRRLQNDFVTLRWIIADHHEVALIREKLPNACATEVAERQRLVGEFSVQFRYFL